MRSGDCCVTTPLKPTPLNRLHVLIDVPRFLLDSRGFEVLTDHIPPGELLYAVFQEMYANDAMAYEMMLDARCPPLDFNHLERQLMLWIEDDYDEIKKSFDAAFVDAQGLRLLECRYHPRMAYLTLIFSETQSDYERVVEVSQWQNRG